MNDQEFDRLLDGALSTYAAEPEAGLPARVMSGLRRPRFRWAAWAVGAAAAAAVIITFWGPKPTQRIPVPSPVVIARQEPPPPAAMVPAAQAPKPAVVRRSPVAQRRADVLTAEEKRLVALVTTHPELVEQAFAPAPAPSRAPLSIAPLEIEPLAQPQ